MFHVELTGCGVSPLKTVHGLGLSIYTTASSSMSADRTTRRSIAEVCVKAARSLICSAVCGADIVARLTLPALPCGRPVGGRYRRRRRTAAATDRPYGSLTVCVLPPKSIIV
jgi:hypothetical protein